MKTGWTTWAAMMCLAWATAGCDTGEVALNGPVYPPGYRSPWDQPPDEVQTPNGAQTPPGYISPWEQQVDDPSGDPLQTAQFALQAAQSCDDVMAQWRQTAIDEMVQRLYDARWNLVHPSPCYDDEEYWGYSDCVSYADASAPAEEEEEESASDYSTTNNQEVGVDEADFLKNDGSFIYILADGQLQILDAWPPDLAHRISQTLVDGEPQRLFVHKDRAVVFSALGGYGYSYDEWGYSSYGGTCTYGYDCEFTGDGRDLLISVFDIRDKAHPELLRTVEFSGTYLSARRIEDLVYTVLYFDAPGQPNLPDVPEALEKYRYACASDEIWRDAPTVDQIDRMYDNLKEQNTQAINQMTIVDWLPGVRDTIFVNGQPQQMETPLTDCRNYLLSKTGDGQSLLSLVSFDLTADEPLAATTVVSRPGAVYASETSLYVANRHYRYELDEWYGEWFATSDDATTIHRFELSPESPQTTYTGSGLVQGRILNQFSMSEHDGFLRVATTSGYIPDPDAHNTVSILSQNEDGLQVVGELDDLAPGEDIRSVRFGSDIGYVVTFKKTDPLFVIDLAEPTAPRLLGELQIPGFSTYMHFMDAGHLLTIGYDADDQGDFAWFAGIALQVFDVSVLSNPRLLWREVIGSRGSASDAATDHLAFNYYKPRNLLSIPMVVCEGGSGGSYGDQLTFDGLMVYRVTIENGFEYLGGIPHTSATVAQQEYEDWGYNPLCSQWWSGATSTVKRSIVMEDYVYSVASDAIDIAALEDLTHPVCRIALQ